MSIVNCCNLGNVILVGLSSRTNEQSIKCLQEIFPYYPVISIDLKTLMDLAAVEYNRSSKSTHHHHQMEEVLHLKSFCSACGDGKIVVGGLIGQIFKQLLLSNKMNHLFKEVDIIHVPDAAAANCIYANETIIRRSSEEYPDSVKVFLTHPYLKLISQLEVRSDELAKVDGALTCCSVLF
jgi:N-dimethylarginine dimethylaminohydrolase